MSAIERAWREGGALATALRPLGALHGALGALRAAGYRRGRPRVLPSALPVLVVGNVSVGGTGKTPLTARLVAELRERGWRPGIVSRGYGGARHDRPRHVRADDAARDVGDEPLMLHRATGAPVCVCARRALAVAALARDTDCDVVLSDDGLQHLAMARDAEIVVVDAERGFGNGRLLPAGPLRERPARLLGADPDMGLTAGQTDFRADLRPDGQIRRQEFSYEFGVFGAGADLDRGGGRASRLAPDRVFRRLGRGAGGRGGRRHSRG